MVGTSTWIELTGVYGLCDGECCVHERFVRRRVLISFVVGFVRTCILLFP
jgi:hypothetical protein